MSSDEQNSLLHSDVHHRRYDGEERMTQEQREDLSDHVAPERHAKTPHTTSGLRRELSTRQVSMIAIAGTIGTGLFLGTGRSLAQGGPARSLLDFYIIL